MHTRLLILSAFVAATAAISPSADVNKMAPLTAAIIQSKECPIETVTVYVDRAEIVRKLIWKVPETTIQESGGLVKVKVEGLGQQIMEDSVRVDARKGDFVLKEVSSGYDHVTNEDRFKDSAEVKGWFEELDQLVDAVALLKSKIASSTESGQLLDKFCSGLVDGRSKSGLDIPAQPAIMSMDVEGLEGGFARLGFLMSNRRSAMEEISKEKREFEKEVKKKTDLANLIKRKIRDRTGMYVGDEVTDPGLIRVAFEDQIQNGAFRQVQSTGYVSILIELNSVSQAQEIEFGLSYLVYSSWTPSYDLRLHWPSPEQQPLMELSYFGSVIQNTGEDWDNVRLILSTAEPSVSGSPPDLPMLRAQFKPPVEVAPRYNARVAMFAVAKDQAAGAPMMEMAVQEDKASFATYVIPTAHSIPSDGAPHKVTIGITDLPIKTHYYSTPEVSKHVYLSAAVDNTSDYTFIPSTEVSVYFERSFVTKTNIPNVAPGESFTVFVGNDPRIKLEKTPAKKFRKSIGMINKSFRDVTETTVHIQNNKALPVEAVVILRVPRSTDEKIKIVIEEPTTAPEEISLQEDSAIFGSPQFSTPAKSAVDWYFNKETNNVLCRVSLNPSQKKSIVFGYFMESPQEKEVIIVS